MHQYTKQSDFYSETPMNSSAPMKLMSKSYNYSYIIICYKRQVKEWSLSAYGLNPSNISFTIWLLI